MIDGATVFYNPSYPKDTFRGEIDGKPWAIGRKKDRYVVRLKNMDKRYREKYGRTVVSFTDLKFISRRRPNE
jgi:hypothetical protein